MALTVALCLLFASGRASMKNHDLTCTQSMEQVAPVPLEEKTAQSSAL